MSSNTVTVTGNGSASAPFAMTVRLSTDSNNGLTVGSDGGLYAPPGGGGGGVGPAGKSAYEIWLDEGHTGTEADFLEWLRGKSAYEIWLDEGHTGTEADFLDWLVGPPGPPGPGGGGGGGAGILELPVGDPIPSGTPAGTLIVRY